MESIRSDIPADWLQSLDRQQIRRGQGIPTLSILVGSRADARALWQKWSAAARLPCIVQEAEAFPSRDVTGGPPSPASARLIVRPRHAEMDSPAQKNETFAAILRRLCVELEKLGPAQWTAILALSVEPDEAEAYLRDAPEDRAKTFFREGLIVLENPRASRGAENPPPAGPAENAGPAKPTAGASKSRADDFPGESPQEESKTPTDKMIRREPPRVDLWQGTFANTNWLLTRQKVSERTLASFQAAAAALQEAASASGSIDGAGRENAAFPAAGPKAAAAEATEGRARSAAEQFLFDFLNELPETAGLFALNFQLDIRFGPKVVEVDLLAPGLKLAVEIDGYHHFKDADHYRRDRRKDALLQKNGYFVLRFLAEDAVARLEEILEDIRAAVAFRRLTAGG